MNDLISEVGNIHLNINEAKGFDILNSPFYIATSFNGRKIHTDLVKPQSNVQINTEIIWETDKKQVRNARSCYTAIRLDCYTKDDRFVGMALVDLRSAKVIAERSFDRTGISQWIKLLIVASEWSKNSLLLQVSLTIREIPLRNAKFLKYLQASPSWRPETGNMDGQVKLTENGDVQIGCDDEPLEKFLLKLATLEANNLDLQPQDFTGYEQDYYLVCYLFGMHLPLQRFTDASVTLNSLVVIDLMTTFELLSSYFEKCPIVKLYLLSESRVVGVSGIDMSTLTTKVKPETFFGCMKGVMALEEEIVFKATSSNLRPKVTDEDPTLRMHCSLEVLEKVTNIKNVGKSTGVDHRIEVMPLNQLEKLFDLCSSLVASREPSARQMKRSVGRTRGYRTHPCKLFCLDVIIEAITWDELPTYDRMVVHFLHPQVDSRVKVVVDVEETENGYMLMDNVNCKMVYHTKTKCIERVISEYAPEIELRHAVTEELVACPLVIKSPKLSLQNTEYTCLMTMTELNGNQIAELRICLHLEESMPARQPRYRDLSPEIAEPTIMHSFKDGYHCLSPEQVDARNQQKSPAVLQMDDEANIKCKNATEGFTDTTSRWESEVQENVSCITVDVDSSDEENLQQFVRDYLCDDPDQRVQEMWITGLYPIEEK